MSLCDYHCVYVWLCACVLCTCVLCRVQSHFCNRPTRRDPPITGYWQLAFPFWSSSSSSWGSEAMTPKIKELETADQCMFGIPALILASYIYYNTQLWWFSKGRTFHEDTSIKFVRFVRSGVSCVMAVSWEGPPGARSIIHSQGATGATKAELKFQSPRHNTGSFTPQYFRQTFWCIRQHQCHGQLGTMYFFDNNIYKTSSFPLKWSFF